MNLTYEERNALPVIRKLLKRNPDAASLLLKDLPKETAVNILLGAKKELEDLHILALALTAAAGEIVKMGKNDASV